MYPAFDDGSDVGEGQSMAHRLFHNFISVALDADAPVAEQEPAVRSKSRGARRGALSHLACDASRLQ